MKNPITSSGIDSATFMPVQQLPTTLPCTPTCGMAIQHSGIGTLAEKEWPKNGGYIAGRNTRFFFHPKSPH
jgi:hypothetical protein